MQQGLVVVTAGTTGTLSAVLAGVSVVIAAHCHLFGPLYETHDDFRLVVLIG